MKTALLAVLALENVQLVQFLKEISILSILKLAQSVDLARTLVLQELSARESNRETIIRRGVHWASLFYRVNF